jgi:hypothetical protein
MTLKSYRMSRRMLLRGAAVAGTGLIAAYVVGCTDDEEDGSASTGAPTPTAEPETGGAEQKLVAGWYRGSEVKYYDFGANTKLASGSVVATAPIYVFITGMNADGTPAFAQGQHNIIDVKPGDAGYSDLWQVMMVTVGDDYEADSIRSKADVDASGLQVTTTQMFVNCPVVPEGTTLEGGEALVQGWYKGDEVLYPDFGANPAVALPIWVLITGLDAQGDPEFVAGQMNVIDSVPSDEGYSAFWRVNMVTVPAGYQPNSLTSASDVISAGYNIAETDMVVNCPVTVF